MASAPPPDVVARVVRWVIFIVLGYALLHGYLHFGSRKPPVVPRGFSTQSGPQDKDCSGGDHNPLSNFSMLAAIPSYMPALHTQDTLKGTGPAASCGQTAILRYAYATKAGDVIFSDLNDAKDSREIRIGGSQLLAGAEQGIIGMQPGGERIITIPPDLAFANLQDAHTLADHAHFVFPSGQAAANTPIVARVKLLSLSPPLPSGMPMRIVNTKFGRGSMAQCGDTVKVNMTVWKMDGTQVYSTLGGDPLVIQLGATDVPYGLDQGILGMMENGLRTVILPPAYLHPLGSQSPNPAYASLLQAGNETLLAELSLVHVGEEPPSAKAAQPKAKPAASVVTNHPSHP